MKKFFAVLMLPVLLISFCGCSIRKNEEQIKLPVFDQVIDGELETEEEQEQSRKKKYAVSKVNGLRLRKKSQ